MEYTITESYSDIRYTAKLEFNESVYNYLINNTFKITITDLLRDEILEIVDYNVLMNNYGLTAAIRVPPAGKTTSECQLEDSLIKNKGIVIELLDEKTLVFTMIPRCSSVESSELIGFYSSDIKFYATSGDSVVVDLKFTTKLYPRLERAKTFELKELSTDPVLPDDVERPGYTFPTDLTNINYDFNYNTDSSLYVNTDETADPEKVPLYVSKLSAYFIEEDGNIFTPDWSAANSYLYDSFNQAQNRLPITFVSGTSAYSDLLVAETVDEDDNAVQYSASLIKYEIEQYVRKNNGYPDKKYEDTLFFGLRAVHNDA